MTEDVTETPFPGLPDNPDAYEVVGAFAAAQDAHPDDRTLLRRFTARFPQFADDLIAFGYAHATLGWSLTDPVEDEAEAAAPARPPLTDLIAASEERGLSGAALAQALGLQKPVLAALNQRLHGAAEVPRTLAARIADALGRPLEDVAAFFRQPPRLAPSAHYKARRAPSLRVAESRPQASPPENTLADALRRGGAVSEQDRAAWLDEIARGDVLGEDFP